MCATNMNHLFFRQEPDVPTHTPQPRAEVAFLRVEIKILIAAIGGQKRIPPNGQHRPIDISNFLRPAVDLLRPRSTPKVVVNRGDSDRILDARPDAWQVTVTTLPSTVWEHLLDADNSCT